MRFLSRFFGNVYFKAEDGPWVGVCLKETEAAAAGSSICNDLNNELLCCSGQFPFKRRKRYFSSWK
jgi:hypothetical protein